MSARGGGRSGRRRGADAAAAPKRQVNYRRLTNPFPTMNVFSDDEIAAMHETALTVLETLGIKVLLPEARRIFAAAGATVHEDSQMVHIGREIIEAALKNAPRDIHLHGATPDRDVHLALGRMTFQPGAGAPHATDRLRGRRPGTISDFRELVKLCQHFDAIEMIPLLIEAQDVPTHLRHYATMEAQLTLSDKVPFAFARGTPQVEDGFEMVRDFRGLSDDAFKADVHSFTIINTNSPRQIDIPMAQGLIDFARWGQLTIVTPFTLMGAMAPITVAGALTLSHAEALAAIALVQMTRAGAPVLYGTFTSNVDMRSGSPTFGTPEHFKASLAAGQLARLIGLPWRSASGSASNISDVQAAQETQFGLWGCMLAGATVTLHSAGWLEGGLTVSFEKFITDMEVVQMMAELAAPTAAGPAEIGLDALTEVAPGGHFFASAQTMARYQTEFYDPIAADVSNFGTWTERGSRDATTRATAIWQSILEADAGPKIDPDRRAALSEFIARRTEAGGAPPES